MFVYHAISTMHGSQFMHVVYCMTPLNQRHGESQASDPASCDVLKSTPCRQLSWHSSLWALGGAPSPADPLLTLSIAPGGPTVCASTLITERAQASTRFCCSSLQRRGPHPFRSVQRPNPATPRARRQLQVHALSSYTAAAVLSHDAAMTT